VKDFLNKYVSTTKTVNNQLKSFKNKVETLEDQLISIRTGHVTEQKDIKTKIYNRRLS